MRKAHIWLAFAIVVEFSAYTLHSAPLGTVAGLLLARAIVVETDRLRAKRAAQPEEESRG